MSREDSYNTNEMCSLCDVSRKALRYYEEKGMLSEVPRLENNYRYYTHEHIYEVVAIKAMKNFDMSLSEMKSVIFGTNVDSIQMSLRQQMESARVEMEQSLQKYEQSAAAYTRISEILSLLRYRDVSNPCGPDFEEIFYPGQRIISIPYEAPFEDDWNYDVIYLPKIQALADEVDAVSISSLIYITQNHFDSETCTFNHKPNPFRIAIPISRNNKKCKNYEEIPAFRGVTALHIGDPKGHTLLDTYVDLLKWAKEKGFRLENWSVEEWLVSPMITNNKDLWVIRIMIPFAET